MLPVAIGSPSITRRELQRIDTDIYYWPISSHSLGWGSGGYDTVENPDLRQAIARRHGRKQDINQLKWQNENHPRFYKVKRKKIR